VPETEPISVLFADDHEIFREALVALYSSRPELAIVGQCSDGLSALQMIRSLIPDFAIIDLHMPKLDGLELIRKLREPPRHPTKLIVLSMSRDRQTVAEALRAGAEAYLPKDCPSRHVLAAIQYIRDGGVYLSPLLHLDSFSSQRAATGDPTDLLSEREHEVFYHLVRGIRAKQIAAHLKISPKTVDTYRASILRKLDLDSVAALVRFAVERKLISEGVPFIG